jgi:glycosyltransferase involved in cell wall biosynthesis
MDYTVTMRPKIGFLFLATYASWTGGVIYILNLVRALNLLPDTEKPHIVICYDKESPIKDILDIGYPYLDSHIIQSHNLIDRVLYKVKRTLTGKSHFYDTLPAVVYPYSRYIALGKTPIHWIPDFQEHYLPQLFSESEIVIRKNEQKKIALSRDIVVFSSKDAMHDFQRFYPKQKCVLRLLSFASILPEFGHVSISNLRQKYGIHASYVVFPNQFWTHKNHKLVLESLVLLKDHSLNFQIVFTGSTTDRRNKDHFKLLLNFIKTNKIDRWIKIVGFIDREEQLCLMRHANFILQPSLFEGWSTVVEDTKAMSQFIVLSDIPVHREQIEKNCHFFDPNSAEQLADLIKEYLLHPPVTENIDYSQNVRNFSKQILEVLRCP